MKNFNLLFTVLFIIGMSFISCGEDETTGPDSGGDNLYVEIASPADGQTFVEGDTINFTGSGLNLEGGVLEDSMLVWVSDIDDTIGIGGSFIRDDLSINHHIITLTGTDSEGKTGSESVDITITRDYYRLITVSATAGYQMGWGGISDDEIPVHTVSLDSFRIGKYEITYGLWKEVMDWAVSSGGYTFTNEGRTGGCYPAPCVNTDRHPVTEIDWRDCIAWCNAYSEMEGLEPVYYTSPAQTEVYRSSLPVSYIYNDYVDWSANGYRLPTEAEWEYAARYIDGTMISSGGKHSGYNIYVNIEDCAWFYQNSVSGTHPVGELKPNSLGAHDMSGNVWELCWDIFGEYPSISQDNPHGPDEGTDRVMRGGSWNGYASYCQTSYRRRIRPRDSFYNIGFRVCRNVE
ncbi:MAG: SUMF1/EgtB/PvdO family nonheme iron enzyme [Candidatus Krumholzibacteriales bacterium]